MMGLGRERRLNCRLYVDRQADAIVVEMLDRLLAEKHFLNQTELIKHGIELVYSEVHEDKGVLGKVSDSGADAQVLAELLVNALKPVLQQMLGDFEERIADSMRSVNAGVVDTGAVGGDALHEAVVLWRMNQQQQYKSQKRSRLQRCMMKRHFQALRSAF